MGQLCLHNKFIGLFDAASFIVIESVLEGRYNSERFGLYLFKYMQSDNDNITEGAVEKWNLDTIYSSKTQETIAIYCEKLPFPDSPFYTSIVR